MSRFNDRAGPLLRKGDAVDWVFFIVLAVILCILEYCAMPFCRPFEWTDPTINHAWTEDTFPTYSIYLLIVLLPVFYYLFVKFAVRPLRFFSGEPMSMYTSNDCQEVLKTFPAESSNMVVSAETLHQRNRSMKHVDGPIYPWIRTHLWANILQLFIMDMLKFYAGRLRPDFLARLAKAGYTQDSNDPNPQFNPQFYCNLMSSNYSLKDGRMSFPSGHTSAYFSMFTVMSLFLFTHLRPFARRGSYVRLVIALSPLTTALVCAVSRTRDNRHNFSDILAGSVLGAACAVLAWKTSFREAGGPLTVYLARSEFDVEYLRHYRPCLFKPHSVARETSMSCLTAGLGMGKSVPYESTASRSDEMKSVETTDCTQVKIAERSRELNDHTTMSISGNNNRTVGVEVPRGMFVTECELNENPAAVSWL